MSHARPTVAQWDPDVDGPQPPPPERPTPEYAVKFLLCHLRAARTLGDNLHGLATVEYVARKALGQACPLPRYAR